MCFYIYVYMRKICCRLASKSQPGVRGLATIRASQNAKPIQHPALRFSLSLSHSSYNNSIIFYQMLHLVLRHVYLRRRGDTHASRNTDNKWKIISSTWKRNIETCAWRASVVGRPDAHRRDGLTHQYTHFDARECVSLRKGNCYFIRFRYSSLSHIFRLFPFIYFYSQCFEKIISDETNYI